MIYFRGVKLDKETFSRAKLKDFQHLFEQTAEIYEHKPDRGLPREKAVLDFFKYHLPKKYGVTTGKIIDRNGNLSKQMDIIIYDSVNSPILYSEKVGPEYDFIPADSVVGNPS